MGRHEEQRFYKIEPRLAEEIGGAFRGGGANAPGVVGEEVPFKAVSTGEKVEFSEAVRREIDEVISRYPKRQAALLPVLWIAQRELGHISLEAMETVADILGCPPSRVYSVVSFYTMYKPRPEGRYDIQVCTNITCSLLGADRVVSALKEEIGVDLGQTTADGLFTLKSVECVAYCEQAPCIQVNETTHGNMDEKGARELIRRLRDGASGPERDGRTEVQSAKGKARD